MSAKELTKAELDAIKARENDATLGPWEATKDGNILFSFGDPVFKKGSKYTRKEDIVFAAHAREDVSKLLGEVERLRGLSNKAVDQVAREKDAEIEKLKAQLAATEARLSQEKEEIKAKADEYKEALGRVRSWVSPNSRVFIDDVLNDGPRRRAVANTAEIVRHIRSL